MASTSAGTGLRPGATYSPSLAETREMDLDQGGVAISREVVADLDTPVSAYLKIRGEGASFLLESAEGGERIGRYSFVGSAPRRVLRVRNGRRWFEGDAPEPCADPLDAVQEIAGAYAPLGRKSAPFEGGALGYLSYEAVRSFERLPSAAYDPLDLPDAVFFDVDTLLIFDHVARRARIVSHIWPDDDIERAYMQATERIERLANRLMQPLPHVWLPPASCDELHSNMPRSRYEEMVEKAKEYIAAGDILQVVLAQRLSVPYPDDAFDLYRRLRVVSPAPYMYYLDFGDHQLVGASPELLVQVKSGVVSTRPIAGTRPRGHTAEEDERLGAWLLADEKERAEHLMLVDLARNDVGRVSVPGSVRVTKFMDVERFSHVMHLVSDVEGTLSPEHTALDALRAAFPAGTVSGAPKIRAMEIIAEQEEDRRGPYAGCVGFVDGHGDMEMAITIRTGVVKDGTLHIEVGAGLVADSVPANEWVETMNKARALLEAAGVYR